MTPGRGAVHVADTHILPMNFGLHTRFDATCSILQLSTVTRFLSTKKRDLFHFFWLILVQLALLVRGDTLEGGCFLVVVVGEFVVT